MMKKALLAMSLGISAASAATVLGFGVEADYYNPTVSGDFSYKTSDTRFSGEKETAYQLGFYLEHPVPMLPNIRIDYTPETTFSGADSIIGTNKVSFTQLDGTLYYEILDNVVDLDLGVTFKALDGKVAGTINESFSEVIPMGYVGAAVMFPGVPLSISGSAKYLGYSGDSFTDARIKAVWKVMAGLEAQAGYRYEALKINDRFDMNADMTIKGPFVGIGYSF